MRLSPQLEPWRIVEGDYASKPGEPRGAFKMPGPLGGRTLITIIASDGDSEIPWEHVSVSLPGRTPNWLEMSYVKDLCWAEDECVVQYHPAKSDHINIHPHCLHLWRPIDGKLPMPPKIAV